MLRPGMEALLRDPGLTNREVSRRTGAHPNTIARYRLQLGLPARPSGRPLGSSTPQSLYWERVRDVDGGHLGWAGSRNRSGVPFINWAGRTFTAGRVAFVMKHGRPPVGRVRSGCAVSGCVAPRCVMDQPMREQLQSQFVAIFGGS